MQAIALEKYGPPHDLRLKEVAKPVPGDGEVLVKVHAASVNDWDWGMVRGKPFYIRLLCGLAKPKIQIPGVDIAGRVEAVGANATRFAPGAEVYGDLSGCGFGGFAEYVCAPETALTPKPAAMTDVEAAALPHAAALAIQGLREVGQLQPGQTLLINGAGGGVGTLGVQIAKALGAGAVTGVDSAEKLDAMRAQGFDHVIDYAREDFTNSGRRYDLILDAKTNRSPFAYARALKPRGRYVTVGGATTRLLQALALAPLVRRSGQRDVRILSLQPNAGLDYANELYEAGALKPVIDGPYGLDETPKALQRFGAGRHVGKIIIAL